jgi:hypothetical protein
MVQCTRGVCVQACMELIYDSKQVNIQGILMSWSTRTAFIIDVSYACKTHTRMYTWPERRTDMYT